MFNELHSSPPLTVPHNQDNSTINVGQFDIIGDIHGHAEKLQTLLHQLGYKEIDGCFRCPGRIAIFLGDLIDRGKENFKTIEIVKQMVEHGQALAVMGNHEFNGLCFHTKGPGGNYLRKHSSKNISQHQAVLDEIQQHGEDGEKTWQTYLEWFRHLPLFLELNGIRIVHATWDVDAVAYLEENRPYIRDEHGRLSDDFLCRASEEGCPEFDALETVLKGKEISLPGNFPGVPDKDGHLRHKVRVQWWLPLDQWKQVETYAQVARINASSLHDLENVAIPGHILEDLRVSALKNSDIENTPVFFGHYWFTGKPKLLARNTVCLDYSVGKGGEIACYQWAGENPLDASKLVSL